MGWMQIVSLDSHGRKFAEEFIRTVGRQKAADFLDRRRLEKAAYKEAKKVQLPAKIDLKDVLDMYPDIISQMITQEWDLNQDKQKSKMIKDIIGAMTYVIPDIIDEASDRERRAIRYVAEHDNLKITKARHVLNSSLIDPMFDEPDDDGMFDAFMEVHIRMGILIVGIRKVEGRNSQIITMASDVKRIVAEHTGWNITFDQDVPQDRDAGSLGVSARDRRRAPPSRKRPRRPVAGRPPYAPDIRRLSDMFQNDKIEVSRVDAEEDPFDAMTAYVLAKYRKEFEAERNNCPYNTADLFSKEFVFKQHMTWFLAKWINPATGITVVEEFVKETVTDKKLADMLIQLTNLFYDKFKVTGHRGADIMAYGIETRKTYRIVTVLGNMFYPVGSMFESLIHPYESKYKMCGITNRLAAPE